MATPKVLIADDDSNIIYLCEKLLRAEGLDVHGVGRGQEAIQLCRQTAFDLLLLDFKMPDINGLEVLRQVRQIQPDVAAIFITGYGTMETAVEAMRLGAQEFMLKPFEGDVLVAKVRQVLTHRQESAAVVRGDLRTMSLTSIVSINCNEGNQAYLTIRHDGQRADIFFENGNIVHISLDEREGEEVIYEILTWEEGAFELRQDVPPPKRTVTAPWSALLLEGLHRIDEQSALPSEEAVLGEWKIESESEGKEVKEMAKLEDLLKEMAGEIPGFVASAVIGMDGLAIAEYSANPNFDIEVASAQFALVMKLVQKTAGQLGDDEVEDNLVTTKNAYLLTRFLGDGSYYLGIAVDKAAASLGNVRLMARQFADDLWKAIPKRGR